MLALSNEGFFCCNLEGRRTRPSCRTGKREVSLALNGKNRELDVAKNLKMVEWLKAELLDGVARLFKALLRSGSEPISDALASIIIICYLLARRVGINFLALDMKIKSKLQVSIDETPPEDEWSNNLNELKFYLEKVKR